MKKILFAICTAFTLATVFAFTAPSTAKKVWNHMDLQNLELYFVDSIYMSDDDNSEQAKITAPADIGADYTWIIPASAPVEHQCLVGGSTANSSEWKLITNANVDTNAAIARSKTAAGTADYVVINDGSGVMSEELYLDKTRGGTGITSTATFPASGTVTTDDGTSTFTNKTIDADGTGNSITNIENADIKAAAGIESSKLDFTGHTSDDHDDIDTTGKAEGKLLKFDSGGDLVVGDDAGASLSEDNIYVGNGSGDATAVDTTSTGDIEADVTNGLTLKRLLVPQVAKSGADTLAATYHIVRGSAAGGSFTSTLPAAASYTGLVYHFVKMDATNTWTIATIAGGGYLRAQYDSFKVFSDGTNWIMYDSHFQETIRHDIVSHGVNAAPSSLTSGTWYNLQQNWSLLSGTWDICMNPTVSCNEQGAYSPAATAIKFSVSLDISGTGKITDSEGSVALQAAKVGSVLELGGVISSCIRHTNSGAGSLSVTMWVKPNTAGIDECSISALGNVTAYRIR